MLCISSPLLKKTVGQLWGRKLIIHRERFVGVENKIGHHLQSWPPLTKLATTNMNITEGDVFFLLSRVSSCLCPVMSKYRQST